MAYRLLLSGHKPTFELLAFEPEPTAQSGTAPSASLRKVSTPAAPPSCTWIERSPTVPNVIYGSSETEHEVYSFVVERDDVKVTSKRATGCTWPVHREWVLRIVSARRHFRPFADPLTVCSGYREGRLGSNHGRSEYSERSLFLGQRSLR